MAHWLTLRRMALVALAIVAIAMLALPKSHTPHARAQSASPDQILQLAERLLGTTPAIGAPLSTTSVQLFVGALPPDLPLQLPMPPSSTLIGSDERPTVVGVPPINVPGFQSTSQPQTGEHFDVVMDATQSPSDAVAFYKAAMGALGWSSPPPTFSLGFAAAPNTSALILCQSTTGPWMEIRAGTPANGPTDLRVSLDTGNAPQCNPPTNLPGPIPPGAGLFALLPSLKAPDGVTVKTANGGAMNNGGGRIASDALAFTDVSLDALNSNYMGQLSDAGWTQIDAGSSDGLTWSTWTLPGQGGYQGFFYVREGPPSGALSLHMEVSSTDPNAFTSNGVDFSSSVVAGGSSAAPFPVATATATPAP